MDWREIGDGNHLRSSHRQLFIAMGEKAGAHHHWIEMKIGMTSSVLDRNFPETRYTEDWHIAIIEQTGGMSSRNPLLLAN